MAEIDLAGLLAGARTVVERELRERPHVRAKGGSFDVGTLPKRAREWHRLPEAVAVAADLMNSTGLAADGRRQASTASVYEASTGAVVRLLHGFGADFIAIQGDGAFGLFWGARRRERGMCAAITIATFSSEQLAPGLKRKWPGLPKTGLRVGVAQSPLLVKKIGIPGRDICEPVWAGHAVNYAVKAAATANGGQVVITKSLWGWVQGNAYLADPCPCRPRAVLWTPTSIAKIGRPDQEGQRLQMGWCTNHRQDYCSRILAGQYRRRGTTPAGAHAQPSSGKVTRRGNHH